MNKSNALPNLSKQQNVTTELVRLDEFLASHDAETFGWLLRLRTEIKVLTSYSEKTPEALKRTNETHELIRKLDKFILKKQKEQK